RPDGSSDDDPERSRRRVRRLAGLAQGPETGPKLVREQRRNLERGEMAAAWRVVPVDDVENPLGPGARSLDDLGREGGVADRYFDPRQRLLAPGPAILE